jgi:hypothetical protein
MTFLVVYFPLSSVISSFLGQIPPNHFVPNYLNLYYSLWAKDPYKVTDRPNVTRQRSWLRHYATRRKVAGSIPNEVIAVFN